MTIKMFVIYPEKRIYQRGTELWGAEPVNIPYIFIWSVGLFIWSTRLFIWSTRLFIWSTSLFICSTRLFIWPTNHFLYGQLHFFYGQLYFLYGQVSILIMVNFRIFKDDQNAMRPNSIVSVFLGSSKNYGSRPCKRTQRTRVVFIL